MRLRLLSPGEMNESQRQTYDESIAGKRGKAPGADAFPAERALTPLSCPATNRSTPWR